MGRFILAGLVLLLCAGCEETAVSQGGPAAGAPPPATVPAGKSLLYFYRTADLAGSANYFTVSVDGVAVASMAAGTVFSAPVTPGTRRVRVETTPNLLNAGLALALQKKPEIVVNVASGGVAYVKIGANTFDASPTLAQVGAETARGASGGFRAATPL